MKETNERIHLVFNIREAADKAIKMGLRSDAYLYIEKEEQLKSLRTNVTDSVHVMINPQNIARGLLIAKGWVTENE